MFAALSSRINNLLSEQPNVHHTLPVPMVYERVRVEPASWEYHVLTVDVREDALPDVARLNELGREGWLLVGVLDQGATGRSSLVHHYFVRPDAGIPVPQTGHPAWGAGIHKGPDAKQQTK